MKCVLFGDFNKEDCCGEITEHPSAMWKKLVCMNAIITRRREISARHVLPSHTGQEQATLHRIFSLMRSLEDMFAEKYVRFLKC